MKKRSIFLAAMLLSSVVGAMADELSLNAWRPTYTATPVADVIGSGSNYYLYNVGCGAFLEGGADWNTRAAITNGKGVSSLDALISGSCVNQGYKWNIAGNKDGSGISFANKTGNNGYLVCDEANGIWVDGGTSRPYNKWIIQTKENDTFWLTAQTDNINKEGISLYFGIDTNLDSRSYFKDPTAAGMEGFEYTWTFINDSVQAELQPKLKTWWKARGVYASLQKTIANCPADLSEVITMFNAGGDEATLNKVDSLVNDAIKKYYQEKAPTATLSDAIDVTEYFGNVLNTPGNSDKVDYWKRVYTGESQNGTWHINSWSVEGNPGNDGTDMTTSFFENWVSKGSKTKLVDQEMTVTLDAPAAGAYMYVINARPYDQNNTAEKIAGVSMIANLNSNDLSEQDPTTGDYEGMRWYWKEGGFTGYTLVGTDEEGKHPLTLGMKLEQCNIDWLAFKDIKVYALGSSQEAIEHVKNNSQFSAMDLDGKDVLATLADAYNTAIEAYNDASTPEAVLAAYQTILSMKDTIESSVAAYKKYDAAYNTANNTLANLDSDDSNPYYERFHIYLQSELEPGYDTGIEDEYRIFKNGTADYIFNNCVLTAKELEEEIEYLKNLAIKTTSKCMSEGTDCTALLKNADFSAAGGSKNNWIGWTIEHPTVAAEDNNPRGGKYDVEGTAHYSAEVYGGWGATNGFLFDVYQEVEGVENGLYEIKFNGFYRYGDPSLVWNNRNQPIKANLYMGDFETPMPSILNDGFAGVYNEEKDTYEAPKTGAWSPIGEGAETIYIPNDMTAATYSFYTEKSPGKCHYEASTFGLVEGNKMRIGVKKEEKNTDTRHWVLFTNFQLTYMGKNKAASASVINKFVGDAEEILNRSENPLITEWYNALDKAVNAAKDAVTDTAAVTKDSLYQEVLSLNKALKVARLQLDTITDFGTKLTKLMAAADECEDAAIGAEMSEMCGQYSGAMEEGTLTGAMIQEFLANYVSNYTKVKTILDPAATAAKPQEIKDCFINPNFDMDTQWTGSNWGIAENNGEQYNKTFNVYDKLYLPVGHYQFVAYAFYRRGVWDDEDKGVGLDTLNTYMFAVPAEATDTAYTKAVIGGIEMLCVDSIGGDGCLQFNDKANNAGKWYPNKQNAASEWFAQRDETGLPIFGMNYLNFEVTEPGEIHVGFFKTVSKTNDWFVCDRVQLFYTGDEEGIAPAVGTYVPTAIEELNVLPVKTAATKCMINGRVVVVRNGVTYNLQGVVIK